LLFKIREIDMANKDEDAKDKRWITPMKMHGVKPEDYDLPKKKLGTGIVAPEKDNPTPSSKKPSQD
jgi:hypothetical protein